MKRLLISLVTFGCAYATEARTEVSFAPIFNRSAVLQCEMPVQLWGKSDPNKSLEIRMDAQIVATVTSDARGKWSAVLDAKPPGGPHTLEADSGQDSVKLEDIYFGEVWLATGQSNMVMPLGLAHGGVEALRRGNPAIRFVKVPQKVGFPVESEFTPQDLRWKTLQPGPPSRENEIAAVAFYFAEALHQATGRPIGIVQSSYGGTPAEAWTSLDMLKAVPNLHHYVDVTWQARESSNTKEDWLAGIRAWDQFTVALNKWKKDGHSGPRPIQPPRPEEIGNPWSPRSPTILFENMIAPLVPFTTRGVIWYQGEANAGKPDEYRVLFPTLIEGWRQLWNRSDWPFLFVQLSAFDLPIAGDWPGLRAAQAFTRDTIPQTGMAISVDCGEKDNIHPRTKQPVGERLARLALHLVYGKDIASRGPCFIGLRINEENAVVHMDFVERGLQTSDGKPEVPGFEIAGDDRKFHCAVAWITSSDSVSVSSTAVVTPWAVRYAWSDWMEPPVTLQNSEGLPAEPFLYYVDP